MRKSFEDMAIREKNAIDRFIAICVEQYGFTEKEGEKILNVYLKEKAAKIDYGIGKVIIKHGAFWNKEVLDRALELSAQ